MRADGGRLAAPPSGPPVSALVAATDLPALLRATRRAARGKKHRRSVAAFLVDAEPRCLALQRALRRSVGHAEAWRPGRSRTFRIRDPKPRTITVQPFADRVVHHALCAAAEPAFERFAVFDSYACRRGKGQHRAVRRLQRLARAAPWALKTDVAAFFASIPHEPLLELVTARLRDQPLADRFRVVVDDGTGRGLPVGALTSQHLANLYLGVLDHWLQDGQGLRSVRYMDDVVVLGDRDRLRALLPAFRGFLAARLELRLNERVTRLVPVRDGSPPAPAPTRAASRRPGWTVRGRARRRGAEPPFPPRSLRHLARPTRRRHGRRPPRLRTG